MASDDCFKLSLFLMHLIIQCAYPEKYTPLLAQQHGYPGPLRTIACLLCNMHKANFLVLKWS